MGSKVELETVEWWIGSLEVEKWQEYQKVPGNGSGCGRWVTGLKVRGLEWLVRLQLPRLVLPGTDEPGDFVAAAVVVAGVAV